MNSQKVNNHNISSFRRKPESSVFGKLSKDWAPVFTGVAAFNEAITFIRSITILYHILFIDSMLVVKSSVPHSFPEGAINWPETLYKTGTFHYYGT